MATPILSRNPNFAGNGNNADIAYDQDSRITVEGVVVKSVVSFAVLLATAALGWMLVPAATAPVLALGLLGGFVLGLVNSFKREPSPALILAYAGFEGLLLGGISHFFEASYHGVVLQAVLGTFVVAGIVLGLFSFAGLRATARATKIWLVATLGYVLFSLVNVLLMVTGVVHDPYGLSGSVTFFGVPLGIVLDLFAVVLASYALVSDFTHVERAVQLGVDERYGWTAAFGIMVSLVWLYLEILRILGLSRR